MNSQTVIQNKISEISRIPRAGFIKIQLSIAMDMCKSGATPTFSTHYSGNEPALLKEQDRSREWRKFDTNAVCELSVWCFLTLLRGVYYEYYSFPLSSKTNISQFQFDEE